MRIGILTLPLHANYGGLLQAYALQTVLERMGHNVVVFDSPNHMHISGLKKCFAYPKRCVDKYLLGKNIKITRETTFNRETKIIRKYVQPFTDKYIHRCEVTDFDSLQNKDFDVLIVGSDQIWRPVLFKKIEDAFFNFAKDWNVKRIAYAASFGVDNWEFSQEQTFQCKKLIQMFDAVSVREKSGVELCQTKLGRNDTQWVLDPTMLLDQKDYLSLINSSNTGKSEGQLFYYILDATPLKISIVDALSSKHNLKSFKVSAPIDDFTIPAEMRVQPPVEKWLAAFRDADFVVTDSFHACVFSILFQKQFVVIGNQFRGSTRMQSLLEMFGLSSRLVDNIEEAQRLDEIDYNAISERLSLMREKSTSFLFNSLMNKL